MRVVSSSSDGDDDHVHLSEQLVVIPEYIRRTMGACIGAADHVDMVSLEETAQNMGWGGNRKGAIHSSNVQNSTESQHVRALSISPVRMREEPSPEVQLRTSLSPSLSPPRIGDHSLRTTNSNSKRRQHLKHSSDEKQKIREIKQENHRQLEALVIAC